ncbi:MAG: hypothetical protein NT080_07525 [Spirochaetes bacterium]|nr:hypothetical protein [Spirochaetota bacterium]
MLRRFRANATGIIKTGTNRLEVLDSGFSLLPGKPVTVAFASTGGRPPKAAELERSLSVMHLRASS